MEWSCILAAVVVIDQCVNEMEASGIDGYATVQSKKTTLIFLFTPLLVSFPGLYDLYTRSEILIVIKRNGKIGSLCVQNYNADRVQLFSSEGSLSGSQSLLLIVVAVFLFVFVKKIKQSEYGLANISFSRLSICLKAMFCQYEI